MLTPMILPHAVLIFAIFDGFFEDIVNFGAKFAEEAAPIESHNDDEGSTALDTSATSTFDEIQMVYIRHGESMGNGTSDACAILTRHFQSLNLLVTT